MKAKILFLITTMALALDSTAQTTVMETLYKRLDKAIENSDTYTKERDSRISLLKDELRHTREPMEVYDVCMRLYKQYAPYQNDSAVAYLKRSAAAAHKAGRADLAEDCRTITVKQLSLAGYYAEALSELGSIDKKKLGKNHLRDYFVAANHLYGELGAYSFEPDTKDMYNNMATVYRDSLYSIADKNDGYCMEKRINDLVNDHKYNEALAVSDKHLRLFRKWSHEYATAAYFRQFVYLHANERDSMKYWLAVSAICDVENAVRDQASLWLLAGELNHDGDAERAYHYISFAWEVAQRFGTRIRSWQISPLLKNIDKSIQDQSVESNRRLTALVTAISLLALMLVASLIYVARQHKRIAEARNKLREANKQLSTANDNLQNANSALADSNVKLHESNFVKEVYIGRFIDICAQNMDKKELLRRDMARLLKARDYEGLARLAKSTDDKEKDQYEFYTYFDDAFLSLFPDFVEQFNSLLREEERLQQPEPMRLNTPLRIYALVRLGIDNSQKIANLLHHSLNTIYNYRARMRNAAIGDRDEFEKKVKKLGRIA